MGTGESGIPTSAKQTTVTQPSTPAPCADWATAIQVYYTSGSNPPSCYFTSSVTSGSQPHPYVWGGQPLMAPYGTPPSYAVYPPGGTYAHHSMPPATIEGEGKTVVSVKKGKMRGSLGMATGKGDEDGKGNSSNGVFSASGESASEESSDRIEEGNQQDMLRKRRLEQTSAETAGANCNKMTGPYPQVGGAQVFPEGHVNTAGSQIVTTSQMVGGEPAEMVLSRPSLNTGMDYWTGSTTAAAIPTGKGRVNSSCVPGALPPTTMNPGPGCDGASPDLWLQDERELKRQRRKQANRESARRSRMRKQTECDELAAKVESLTAENKSLQLEVNRLGELCTKLSSENSSLLERVQNVQAEPRDSNDHGNIIELHREGN